MKKLLLIFIALSVFNKSKAQIVFCPPGAEWHYSFNTPIFSVVMNEKILYLRDSIIGSDNVKVLSHCRFFKQCNVKCIKITLVKQKGDTIYFKNGQTQNSWQILYNFACTVGQGWQTTITQSNAGIVSFSYVVESVTYVYINGFNLKQLKIVGSPEYITERFGSSEFLFNYDNGGLGSCDGDRFQDFLCYQDSSFGLKQFTSKPCDFANLSGLADFSITNSGLKIFPNPTSNILNLKLENRSEEANYEIRLLNVLGKEILLHQETKSADENFVLDLSAVKSGIYFVQVFEKEKLIATEKIVKE